MSRAKKIKYIAHHCSAGFGNIASMQKFWRSKGWKTDGYNIVIDLDGNIIFLVPLDKPSNGVLGFNDVTINICYIGGVEVVTDAKGGKKYVPKDTRTRLQEIALVNATIMVIEWLRESGNDCSDVQILGHRDFSPDQNGNGKIEEWERIKACPSYPVIEEYKEIQKALNGKLATLPKRK